MNGKIFKLLDEIKVKIGADSVLLALNDGIFVSSTDNSSKNHGVQSAMSATILGTAELTGHLLEFEDCYMNITVFKSVGKKLIIISVGEKSLLSIIADISINENTIEASIAKETSRISEII